MEGAQEGPGEGPVVEVGAADIEQPAWAEALGAFAAEILHELEIEDGEVSITLCSDAFIEDLNGTYRGIENPTDVLSFSQNEGYDMGVPSPSIFGDIVVSTETVKRQAEHFQVENEEELKRVVIHGILHLLGIDHESNREEEEPMLKRQEELLKLFSGVHLF